VSLTPRTWRRATLGALAATLLLTLPAGAHPFVRGGEAPVDSVATVALAMAHGCGTEESGGGDPTLEIALEVPDALRVVEVADDPEYDHGFEVDDDGRIEVVTWTATGDGEPAPDVEFDAVFSGEVGDEVYLPVFQGCDGFAYRWIGTPDEPADDPAVRVTLVDADPDAPAPPDDESTPAEAAAVPEGGAVEEDAVGDEEVEDDAVGDVAEADEPAVLDEPEEEEAVGLDAEGAVADDGSGVPWLVLVVAAVVLAGLGVVLARRSGGTERSGTPGASSS
jgi:uncharacterized protein YcnI